MKVNTRWLLLGLANIIPLVAYAAPTRLSFIAPRSYTVNFPDCVVAADFNGDGKEDFAVAGTDGVFVFLGTGGGEFTLKTTLDAPQGAEFVAAADLNGDGIQDIVAIDFSDTLSVFLGKGDGTFASPVAYPMDGGPAYLLVGDLNRDGRPDIVAVEDTGINGAFTVYLGTGHGAFEKGASYSISAGNIGGATLGDINQDGNLDLVTISGADDNAGLTIFLGNGDGSFRSGSMNIQDKGDSVALVDVNQDGLVDLIVGAVQGVDVFLGNGNGTFQNPVSYLLGFPVGGLGIADFNGDGFLDIASMNSEGSGAYLLYGAAGGTFVIGPNYPTPSGPGYLATADFNGDGRPDLAIPAFYSDQVEILLNADLKGFVTAPVLQAEKQPGGVIVGDWNGDGIDDLAISNVGSPDISIFLGKGHARFSAPVNYAGIAPPNSVIAADFTGDGVVDLGILSNSNIAILPGVGNGKFGAAIVSTSVDGGGDIAAGDFNRDGKVDVAVTAYYTGGVFVYLSTGDGGFAAPVEYPFYLPRTAIVADFNNDGIPDLAVSYYSGIQILLGVGDGSFVSGGSYTGNQPQNVDTLAVDWNGDGNLDILTVDFITGDLNILYGNGDGTVQAPVVYPVSYPIGTLLVGDYNGDGVLDLAYSSGTKNTTEAVILPGNGKGGFKTPVYFTVGSPSTGASNGHFLSKSKTDVVIATDDGVALLLNVTP